MSLLILTKLGVALALAAACVVENRSAGTTRLRPARLAFGAWAIGHLVFVAFLWGNHVAFPLHLDLMEGVVLQHAERLIAGLPVYPEPSPQYVPLAYNAGFYVLAAPLVAWLDNGLVALRLTAIAGMAVCLIAVWLAVRARTGSATWAVLAAGTFAAAYRAMDAYLDTAHADSWMLACVLVGTWLLTLRGRGGAELAGVAVLAGSFWLKQHGALFAAGAVMIATLRHGIRGAWTHWLIAILIGPMLYLGAGPPLLGDHLHYFTLTVPSGWSTWRADTTVVRLAGFVALTWPALGAAVLLILIRVARDIRRAADDPWVAMFPAALAAAFLGSLDPGSSDNVFIPLCAWFIVLGTAEVHQWCRTATGPRKLVAGLALSLTAGALTYDVRDAVMPRAARRSYADLVATIRALPGSVYMPAQGYLGEGVGLSPQAHWVALDDIQRGPHRSEAARALAAKLLEPARQPVGAAWVISNFPLPQMQAPVRALAAQYRLEADWGERYRDLAGLPKRFAHGYPRYLYRYVAPGPHGGI